MDSLLKGVEMSDRSKNLELFLKEFDLGSINSALFSVKLTLYFSKHTTLSEEKIFQYVEQITQNIQVSIFVMDS